VQDLEMLKRIFSTASEEELAQGLAKHGAIGGSMNPLYISTGDYKILADVGFGTSAPEGLGNVIPRLGKIGVAPEDITDVVITHFHGDHMHGLTDAEGKPLYPNANVTVNETEWTHWMSAKTLEDIGEERANGLKLRFNAYEGKIRKVHPNDEIFPGVTVVEAYGHSPGHIGLMVESNGERLLHLVDTAHIILQDKHPEWSPGFDSQPDVSPVTRRKWFEYASDENILTLWYHFPFPGLGHFSRDEDAFKWTPIGE
jgi:glyoxylase-like metal-dependent hydrolase (beta-lactamase superfamily II)